MKGLVFNIQRFSIHDGPGIRTVVFLKGCPLHCAWCHNPESQCRAPEILFYKEKCVGCGRCHGITAQDADFVCKNDAKEICGKEMRAGDVLTEVLKDRVFYENSGGGLTLSGGEPLFQSDFSLCLLKKAKEAGVHTAMETCGLCSPEKMAEFARVTDFFLFDYKETDPRLHREFTGAGNERILDNLRLLNTVGKPVVLRCPLVPGYNDRREHLEGICRLANGFSCVQAVEAEPYHALGEHKARALGKKIPHISVPDEAKKAEWLSFLTDNTGKPVRFA